jgi:hypothetical protein
VEMSDEKNTTENEPARVWTDQEKIDAYNRAAVLVRKKCPTRPEAWREDVASRAWERWSCESRGAPVDQWVTWVIADASEETSREEHPAGDTLGETEAASPWRASTNTEAAGAKRYDADEQEEAWTAVRERAAAEYAARWGHPWDPSAARWVHERSQYVADQNDIDTEKDAERALKKLRAALADVIALIDAGGTVAGNASLTIVTRENEIRAIAEALASPSPIASINIAGREFAVRAGQFRVHKLADSDLRRYVQRALTMPEVIEGLGCTTQPSTNELTDIWILSGGRSEIRSWPKAGKSAAEIIEGIRRTVATAEKEIRAEQGPLVRRVSEMMVKRSSV